ncbi:DNA alkylation repair protein [Halobacillus salinarum]|uniref:DNA alkylation repair protein n=1 Tax=Halobacillus salinarum TaxID=2932257 RepID=A0ABY4EIB2_9BACI|nr:DNA alkylation repair protein [Halobacillus salinarum]UOQ43232.1 DNA alkylation repair protein [Halobacillus salinarum]
MNRSDQFSQVIWNTLNEHANENNRPAMEAYMKHRFAFFGIKTPERKQLLKPLWKEYKDISETERLETAKLLFSKKERECHYAGLALLERGANKSPRSAVGFYHELLKTHSWWDTVDMIAANLCGEYFRRFPEYLVPVTESWRSSTNMWVRRSSLLHQLSYKEKTNEALLFSTVDLLKEEKEFFIEKAIGWALREYSKTEPERVINYLEQTDCRPLSRREGLKWLKNKGMITT